MDYVQLSLQDKTRASALLVEGWSVICVAAELKVTRRTIYKLKTAADNFHLGAVPTRKPGFGVPRKISLHTGKVLAREVKGYLSITAVSLKEKRLNLLQNVSVRTIQHCLQDLQLSARHAGNILHLMETMKKRRLDFCRKYKEWTLAD
ncbi:hypothetical protein E2C01_088974 [Portunus trituberculatus]|uniref:Transposase Tc1-like domain-containing protein n=1 Tax=Portunus trituberculatus TaxID=210409 RepID=A0A5B7JG27_PORTR|nr:hypothetical protein [Portunus trituberculatus]